jgi:hypothetical protein
MSLDISEAQAAIGQYPIEFSHEFALGQYWKFVQRRLPGDKRAYSLAVVGRFRYRTSESASESLGLISEESGARPVIALDKFGRKPLNQSRIE